MKSKPRKFKIYVLNTAFAVLLSIFSIYSSVSAVTPTPGCGNRVPNPLNPDCTGTDPDVGGILNRGIGYIPTVFIISVVASFIILAAQTLLTGGDASEKIGEFFKGIMKIGVVVAAMGLLWAFLFLIQYFTGGNILGQIPI